MSKINDWTYKGKMSFNPDSTKPAHQVVLYRKKITFITLRLLLTMFLLSAFKPHKHLGLTLDSKLNFHENISSILSKVNKLNPVLWKLQTVLSRHSLLTIYNAFIRTHLDYNDVIYDKIFNESWHKKLESGRGYSRH